MIVIMDFFGKAIGLSLGSLSDDVLDISDNSGEVWFVRSELGVEILSGSEHGLDFVHASRDIVGLSAIGLGLSDIRFKLLEIGQDTFDISLGDITNKFDGISDN
jgi:hypothetical protein